MAFSSDLKDIRGGSKSQFGVSKSEKQLGLFWIPFTAYHCMFMCLIEMALLSWPVLPPDDSHFFRTNYVKVSMKKHGFLKITTAPPAPKM